MRRAGRIAARVAVFALIGAVMTVLVCWGSGLFAPFQPPLEGIQSDTWVLGDGGPAQPPTTSLRSRSLLVDTIHQHGEHRHQSRESYGWPARAMFAEAHLDRQGREHARRGVFIESLHASTRRMLPTVVAPVSFLVDTAFYGGLAFLVWGAPGFVRRGVRRRRGQCVRCGYELKGMVVCPECGGGA